MWGRGGVGLPAGAFVPGAHQVLLSPLTDEGIPSRCLWWSPMGGEVTHVPHIEELVEPVMAAPAPVF